MTSKVGWRRARMVRAAGTIAYPPDLFLASPVQPARFRQEHSPQIESDPSRPRYLVTEAGIGYRLVVPTG